MNRVQNVQTVQAVQCPFLVLPRDCGGGHRACPGLDPGWGLERLELLERLGVTPIDWTVMGARLEYRPSEFLGLILFTPFKYFFCPNTLFVVGHTKKGFHICPITHDLTPARHLSTLLSGH
jgi:hypothetical protein